MAASSFFQSYGEHVFDDRFKIRVSMRIMVGKILDAVPCIFVCKLSTSFW